MNDKALKILEFDKIINMLEQKAVSPMGKELAAGLKPGSELYDIRNWQKETTEAVAFILKKGSLPLGGIKDIRGSVVRAEMAGVLMIEELMGVGEFLYVCRKIESYAALDGKRDSFEKLDPLFELVRPLHELEKEINRCIINEQQLADDASPRLSDVRRNLKAQNAKVRDTLNSIIHSQNYKNVLQEQVITIRNGRFCVPVRAEHRNAFQGMVHDQSGTGATVFVEPLSVVTLNNKIKELEADERDEIEKILRRLTGLVAAQAGILKANLEALTRLDFVFAKAELSLSMEAFEPELNERGRIEFKRARHPLLDKSKVVPIDIYLGDKFTTLLITGPNTGGKTVALKTLGLLAVMGHAGLHVPAAENAQIALFDEVFADIGDEQSIEQSLSTFSGHMSNIVKILEEVTPFSLVLLDELGAGTDPTEGAALAVAIIKFLHSRKIRSAVTTHYSELKIFGIQTEGVENAACEFDVESLSPTYRLLIGIPGKSNAFAISKRLGLSEDIIESARAVLSSEDERFEDVITNLEINRKTVEIERERAEQFRRESEKLKQDYEKQKQRLAEQREKILRESKDDAKKILDDAKKDADRIIKDMHRIFSDNKDVKELEEKRGELRQMRSDMEDSESAETTRERSLRPADRPLKTGDRVYIHTLAQPGILISDPEASGSVMVQAGAMKVKVNVNTLSLDDSAQAESEKSSGKRQYSISGVVSKAKHISPSVDLRGLTIDAALDKTDSYLYDAYFAGLGTISIIHGKGTGALRAAIQSYLKKHAHVKSYRYGAFGEGDMGVTIVELK